MPIGYNTHVYTSPAPHCRGFLAPISSTYPASSMAILATSSSIWPRLRSARPPSLELSCATSRVSKTCLGRFEAF